MSMCDLRREDLHQRVLDYIDLMLKSPGSLRGQQLRGGGAVAEFEMLLAERTGFAHCLATSSATSALLVAVLASELSGKKIAVEPRAWEGSLGALEFAGVELVEVPSLLTLELNGVAAVLATDQPNERHDAHALRSRCDELNILYIEDTGWIPGFTGPHDEKSLADLQVLSFGPGKRLHLGEGGALLCRREEVYRRGISLSQHPERVIASGSKPCNRPPFNARMHQFAAILGVYMLQ